MDNEWGAITVDFGSEAEKQGQMKAFANALLYTPDDPYTAARRVFPSDPSRALYITKYWPVEEFVKEHMKNLLAEHGAMHFLPNKADVAREVIKITKESKSEAQKFAGWRFYAELMDMMPQKSSGGGTTNNNLFVGANKVMQVTNFGSNEEYEKRCYEQQQNLLANASEDLAER